MVSKRVLAACSIVIALTLAKRRRRMRNRKIWVHDWIRSRPAQGAYHQLVRELKMGDECSYRNFLRMDPATFELLLSEVGPLITYQDTKMCKAITPGERLALTLRFLATGIVTQFILYYSSLKSILFTHYFCVFTGKSFCSIQYLYRIPSQTVGKIIIETCLAITQVLQDHLKVMNSDNNVNTYTCTCTM